PSFPALPGLPAENRLRLAPTARPACTIPSVRSLARRIPSPSNSKQARLPRRCPRAKRQFALVLIRRGLLQVREDFGNDLRLLDAGDDLEPAAAAGAALDLDTKDPLEPPCPVHGHVLGVSRRAGS